MKKFIIAFIGFIAFVYLTNPTAGIFEFIPDNIPGIGNLDEVTATTILLSVFSYFGINLTNFFKREENKQHFEDAQIED